MNVRPRPVLDGIPASRIQLPPGPWATLLEGLCARFPNVDEATWVGRFARGRVLDAEGRPLDAAAPYRTGAEIHYFREVAVEPRIAAMESIVHADAHLVVAYKPHFLPVAPTGGWVRETLLTRLVQRLGNPALVPLHRIDRETAGLVLFSADPATRGRYQALFRERRIRKVYLADAPPLPHLAFPHVRRSRIEPGEPFFRMREAPGAPNSETRIVLAEPTADPDPDAPGGSRADPSAFPESPIPNPQSRPLWRYRLEPVTGRKHQLRVHMAALGAPIRNDRLYPALQDPAPDDPERPLRLLAQALEFEDPLTGERRTFDLAQRKIPHSDDDD